RRRRGDPPARPPRRRDRQAPRRGDPPRRLPLARRTMTEATTARPAAGDTARAAPIPQTTSPGVYLLRLAGLAALLALALVASIALGAAELSVGEVAAALAGEGDETTRAIVLRLRLPRALLAALVGGALALSGAGFQALLRNPFAEPYILGVPTGAAPG